MKNILKYGIITLLAVAALMSCAKVEYPVKSSECSLKTIVLSVPVPSLDDTKIEYAQVDGIIDEENGKVLFPVPYYLSDVLDIVTEIDKCFITASVPVSAVITPGVGGLLDMTSPKNITVTAADGTTKDYVLEAVLTKSSAKAITKFHIVCGDYEFNGIIKESECTIVIMCAEAMNGYLAQNPGIAEVEVSSRAELVTDITEPIDLSKECVITVKAQDGTTQDWTVKKMAPAKKTYGFGFTSKKWVFNSDHFGYTGSGDYRSMTVTKNYVVVQNRYLNNILIDKSTGDVVKTTTGPSGANTMYVSKDAEGNLVATSATVWSGGTLNVYYYGNGEDQAPEVIAEITGMPECGRKFCVVGSLKTGTAYIYTPHAKGNDFHQIHFENGKYVDHKTVTVQFPDGRTAFTYMPSIVAIDNTAESELIITDQVSAEGDAAGWVNHFKTDGSFVDSMADGARCPSGCVTADGKIFTFNGAKYLMFNGQSSSGLAAHIRIYDITDMAKFLTAPSSETYSSFKVFQSESISSTSNGNGTGAVDFDISEDGETCWIYIMLTSGDIQKVELTTYDM